MAKSMMLENVAVLEISSNKSKDGSKTYNSLVCFEFGQKYPELLKINVHDQLLNNASQLVGKRCNLVAEISVYNDKMSLYFSEGSPAIK